MSREAKVNSHLIPARGPQKALHPKNLGSGRGQPLAAVTTAFMAFYPVVPAWAAAPTPGKVPAPPPPAAGCQLNSPKGNIKHVVTIIFDNTHFMRDPARDGSTLVPSDLEQMPHLLNFLKNN